MAEQIMPATEVSLSSIKGIFDGALIDASLTDDGKVCIAEEGIKVFLSVDTDKQLLTYFLLFGWSRGGNPKDQMELANELNKNIVFMRAWVFNDGIVFDYSLPYDGGLAPKQVVSAYRWLRKTAVWGLQQYDRKNLVA